MVRLVNGAPLGKEQNCEHPAASYLIMDLFPLRVGKWVDQQHKTSS